MYQGSKKSCPVVPYKYIERRSCKCHFAMVAKFLDDNKPKTSLIEGICTVSNFIDLIQIYLICQKLAKFSRVKSKRSVSKLEEKEGKFWHCTHLLHKAGV